MTRLRGALLAALVLGASSSESNAGALQDPSGAKAFHAEPTPYAKFLAPIEALALPSERTVLNDFLAGVARGASNPNALLDASDKALSRLPAPTKLRGFIQFYRAELLTGLDRDLDALDAIQESVRLLPGYSAPLIGAANIYAFLDRPGEGADYLMRAIDIDPQSVRTVPDYDIRNLMNRLNTAHDERRIRSLSDRLLAIGWLGTNLGSRSSLAVEAIKSRIAQGDVPGARALIPKLLVPEHSYALLIQNDYRPLWPDIETWAGPQLGRQWTIYLSEARARWTASKSAQASRDYLSALIAAGHYETAVRDLLPLFDKPDRLQDYDLIFMVNSLADTLARLGRWKDGEALFERAQAVWPMEEHANALNITANHARFLLVEGNPKAALTLMDQSLAQSRRWGPQVNSSAIAAMHHYRACILHQLGRDTEAGVSALIALANESPAAAASMYVCLDDMAAAKLALIAGLQSEQFRQGIIRLVQLPDSEPLPSPYAKRIRAGIDALRRDPQILNEIAKYGRVLPWVENAAAPTEAR